MIPLNARTRQQATEETKAPPTGRQGKGTDVPGTATGADAPVDPALQLLPLCSDGDSRRKTSGNLRAKSARADCQKGLVTRVPLLPRSMNKRDERAGEHPAPSGEGLGPTLLTIGAPARTPCAADGSARSGPEYDGRWQKRGDAERTEPAETDQPSPRPSPKGRGSLKRE